ncbi:MAG: CehA/McbA family metallohydrolase [Alphaproteobacteria bacterium]|nr:CehA/McbA family metallohydrolase [Alphaproteobacteria bacterium]
MSFAAFTRPGRFHRGNLHTHSNLSDGRLEPGEVCRRYAAMGYDFICLSDHFLPEYGFPISDTRPFRTNRFTTLLGAEVHTGAISHGDPWHILAVGLPLDFTPTAASETGPELAERCAAAGAFVAIVHPEWYGLREEEAATITSAHAIEVYNHTSAQNTARGGGAYMLDALLCRGMSLNAIATDDAHFLVADAEDFDSFGGWVMVKAEANEPDALLDALKSGAFYASQGPEIHDMRLEGTTLDVQCSAAVAVIALGRGSRSVEMIGPAQTAAHLDLTRFAGDWCRLVIIDRAGKLAWSNPFQVADAS